MRTTVEQQPHERPGEESGLERGLSNRHIQLMAIGGAIGTGLFMGSGKSISLAGPAITVVYAVIGFMLFFMMRAMGEVLLSRSGYRSFGDVAEDVLGPWAGFMTGWTYWLCWIITGIAEVVAVTGYVAYWWPDLPKWIPAVLMVVLIVGLNMLAVRLFGEMEFWFALIKIVAILALVVTAAVLVLMHYQAPDGHHASVTHLWEHGGFMPKGIHGVLTGFQIAIFSFVGLELVGTTAAEAKDPHTTLPRAINAIPVRILLFYVFALLAIMVVSPWTDAGPDESPFVSTFSLVGLTAAAGLINFVVMTSAASSCNSGTYSTSRMLFGLSDQGSAPRGLHHLSGRRTPDRALLVSAAFLLLSVPLLYATGGVAEAFTLATTVSSVLFIFIWGIILISYIVYRRTRPELHERSAYKMPGGVPMCAVVLAFFVFVIGTLFMADDTRQGLAASLIWFVVMGIGLVATRRARTDAVAREYVDA
ncbi:amino acid permease [Luteipulveratus halotolerans]|uniref:Amino acid permease n=1 Tax=Luteipulveratus halotolerans TaxID=1631356 RepID=A0A0L6CGI4_9MICO|nr:amino acid permease [Luteipulveratus halotolerans]KNX36695.1 amino acid permease [Luteipulveratus halotolerans]